METPIILNRQLWETSGHWFNYKENMYTVQIDEEDYAIKPMNCPGGMLVYSTKLHSYRDFPMRVAELGRVHRHELSGALHGLMRVRAFTQDDAHIFMLPEQIKDEIKGVATLIDEVYKTFGFSYHVELSTRPEKFIGEIEVWDQAEEALKGALEELGLPYKLNEGDGAFYGPKIDFHLRDCIGRTWQCGTIQLDYQMPLRFDLTYIAKDGQKHRPVMIHRVLFGSIERFIAILTENFAGAFPVWIAPTQVTVIPVSERQYDYAKEIAGRLNELDIRVESDLRSEKVGYKIREAQLKKVPYMLIVGDKEVEGGSVSVRDRKEGDKGAMKLQDFISHIQNEIAEKINGRVVCGEERLSEVIEYAFSSDLMSDVLKVDRENILLITGLANLQTIRTSEMSDINCIVFARNKKINSEILSLAEENRMVLIECQHSVFKISGELYIAGIKPLY